MITTSATLQNEKKEKQKKTPVATMSCYGLIVLHPS
jgi:hypothetical protein